MPGIPDPRKDNRGALIGVFPDAAVLSAYAWADGRPAG